MFVLEKRQLETSEDAANAAKEAFEKAKDCDRFLVAMWKVEDGRIHLVHRVSWQFPLDDVAPALRLLLQDMIPELPEKQLLPDAPEHIRKLMGLS